jgi:succinate dehydrogenase/fumarate reductase flavoprotein subunit
MTEQLDLVTDVLVVGGGPAAAWAAVKAAESGADVVLVDKGYLGTSGATASGGTGVWYIQPDPQERAAAKASRETLGGHLADHGWMDRVLDQTYENMNELAEISRYPFPVGEDGDPLPEPPAEADLIADGSLGSYRRQIGWGRGRTPGALLAIGPAFPGTGPLTS